MPQSRRSPTRWAELDRQSCRRVRVCAVASHGVTVHNERVRQQLWTDAVFVGAFRAVQPVVDERAVTVLQACPAFAAVLAHGSFVAPRADIPAAARGVRPGLDLPGSSAGRCTSRIVAGRGLDLPGSSAGRCTSRIVAALGFDLPGSSAGRWHVPHRRRAGLGFARFLSGTLHVPHRRRATPNPVRAAARRRCRNGGRSRASR
jgi:hypothetical protein